MKIKYLYLVLILTLSSILTFTAFKSNSKLGECKKNDSIIKFSHLVHKDATDCASCHSGVKNSQSLSDRLLPTKEDCKTCHDVEDPDNCSLCHFDNINEQLKQKKSSLLFNHKFHLEKKSECESCHQGITEVAYSFQSKQKNPPMAECYSCHGETKTASNNCESCHQSTVNLKPSNHKSVDFISNHKFMADESNADCIMCHDNNSCDDCHISTIGITESNQLKDFYTPFTPSNFTDSKTQKITRVHDINFRFTHGLELRSKEKECLSCHQNETFCVECHNAERVIPLTHTQPGFVTIGKGSGGGQHALLARRDLERCISCHDLAGQDPSCIRCHSVSIN
jgi:hypothetical protein